MKVKNGKIELSEDIKTKIENWYKKYQIQIENSKDYSKAFIGIYTFKSIIEEIDYEIEKEVNEISSKETVILNGEKVICKTRANKIIDEWKDCENIGYSTNEMEKLQMKLDDIFKLKHIKYISFIKRIVESESIIYSYDYSIERY